MKFHADEKCCFVAVEVLGRLRPVYFRINNNGERVPGENNGIEKVDYIFPGPQARYTTWINPEYEPFPDVRDKEGQDIGSEWEMDMDDIEILPIEVS